MHLSVIRLPSRRSLEIAVVALLALLTAAWAGCTRSPLRPADSLRGQTAPHRRLASHSGISVLSTSAVPCVIVTLREGSSAQDLADAHGTIVLDSVPELRMYLLAAPAGSTSTADQTWDGDPATSYEDDPRVDFAESDVQAQTAEGQQSSMAFDEGILPWSNVTDQAAYQRIGAAAADNVADGQGILVAILDTGVQLDHPALYSHLSLPGIEPGNEIDPASDRPEGVDTNGDGIVDGAWGHGTHVAGIVAAVAPAARILPVRVLDSDGVGRAFEIARGLVMAVLRGASVINLSLGMPNPSPAVMAAVDFATSRGVVVVAPAGNEGLATVTFPSSIGSVLCVAGTDSLDQKASFSNLGLPVDLAAPAVGILSTYVGGHYAVWSGTSMAAPFVSGAAALVYQLVGSRSPESAAAVQDYIRGGAVPLAEQDPLNAWGLGSGRLNALASAHLARKLTP